MASLTKIAPRKIALVFNLRHAKPVASDEEEEWDDASTIESLKKEIQSHGFKVSLFEQDHHLMENLVRDRPDFALNIAEGIGCGRARESQVPAILESLKIPYSGSDPIALGVTLDKYLTACLLKSAGVPVAALYTASNMKELDDLTNIFSKAKRYIVKPRWEGSSKGIFLNSIVEDFATLKVRAGAIFKKYHQPVVIEEFLEKDEITVGICGNNPARLLGMMKIVPKDKQNKPFLYSIEIKRDWQAKVEYRPESDISPKLRQQVTKYAMMAYRALELRDVARVDFRVGKDDVARIIDINPLPGLSPDYSDLPILYRMRGGTYSGLVKAILQAAFKRYGFLFPDE